jgi:hypothetical protein
LSRGLGNGSDDRFVATYSFDTERFFEPIDDSQPEILIETDREQVAFDHFLNDAMPVFYTADLDFVDGYTMVPAAGGYPPYDDRLIETVDWGANQVDVQKEFGPADAGKRSVHTFLIDALGASDADVVYYDHGSGEIADFVTLKKNGDLLLVRLYHCKKADGAAAGHQATLPSGCVQN